MWTEKNRAKYNRDHLRYPSDLTDSEWAEIEPLIPPAKRVLTKDSAESREFFSEGFQVVVEMMV